MNKEIKYCLTVLLITFLTWGILIITQIGAEHSMYTLLTFGGALSPAIAAFIVSKDKKELLRSMVDYKNKKVLLLLFVLLPIIILIVGNIMYDKEETLITQIIIFPMYLIATTIGGGLEEIGWRGVLQKQIQEKYNIVICTLIIGFIWAFWHLPLWFIKDSIQADMSFLFFFINIMTTNIIFTIAYKKTNSLFILISLHALINVFSVMFMV